MIHLAAMFFFSTFTSSFSLLGSHFVCLAEGGISWFRQLNPLRPCQWVCSGAPALQPERWEQVLWPKVALAG